MTKKKQRKSLLLKKQPQRNPPLKKLMTKKKQRKSLLLKKQPQRNLLLKRQQQRNLLRNLKSSFGVGIKKTGKFCRFFFMFIF